MSSPEREKSKEKKHLTPAAMLLAATIALAGCGSNNVEADGPTPEATQTEPTPSHEANAESDDSPETQTQSPETEPADPYSLSAETLKTPESIASSYNDKINEWMSNNSNWETCSDAILDSSGMEYDAVQASHCTDIVNNNFTWGLYGDDWESNSGVSEMVQSYRDAYDTSMVLQFALDGQYEQTSDLTDVEVVSESDEAMTLYLKFEEHDNLEDMLAVDESMLNKYQGISVEGTNRSSQIEFTKKDDAWIITSHVHIG